MRPLVASSRPAINRSSEVLPQPEGPTSTMNSPSAIVERDVVDGDESVRELLPRAVDDDLCHQAATRSLPPTNTALELEPVVEDQHVGGRTRAPAGRGAPPAMRAGTELAAAIASASGAPSACRFLHGLEHGEHAAGQHAVGAARDAVAHLDVDDPEPVVAHRRHRSPPPRR